MTPKELNEANKLNAKVSQLTTAVKIIERTMEKGIVVVGVTESDTLTKSSHLHFSKDTRVLRLAEHISFGAKSNFSDSDEVGKAYAHFINTLLRTYKQKLAEAEDQFKKL